MTRRRPQHLKILTRTDRPDREPREPVRPRAGRAQPPAFLPDLERRAFEALAVEVEAIGLPSGSFAHALTGAAVAWATLERCTAFLAAGGESVETETITGALKLVARPEVSSRNTALRLLRSYLVELGLSPAAIGKVDRAALPQPVQANPFSVLGNEDRKGRR